MDGIMPCVTRSARAVQGVTQGTELVIVTGRERGTTIVTTPHDILQSRLASGEVTHEEAGRILERLSGADRSKLLGVLEHRLASGQLSIPAFDAALQAMHRQATADDDGSGSGETSRARPGSDENVIAFPGRPAEVRVEPNAALVDAIGLSLEGKAGPAVQAVLDQGWPEDVFMASFGKALGDRLSKDAETRLASELEALFADPSPKPASADGGRGDNDHEQARLLAAQRAEQKLYRDVIDGARRANVYSAIGGLVAGLAVVLLVNTSGIADIEMGERAGFPAFAGVMIISFVATALALNLSFAAYVRKRLNASEAEPFDVAVLLMSRLKKGFPTIARRFVGHLPETAQGPVRASNLGYVGPSIAFVVIWALLVLVAWGFSLS